MQILHITPHLGGGVGTVICGWVREMNRRRMAFWDEKAPQAKHIVACLDYANNKAYNLLKDCAGDVTDQMMSATFALQEEMEKADIVVVHWWDHPMLARFFTSAPPPCRLVFWCHKNYEVDGKILAYPDLFLDTSPVQGHGQWIWSTGGVERFLEIKPKPHKEEFTIGYMGTLDYKKLHKNFLPMCLKIVKVIPNVHFIIVGEIGTDTFMSPFHTGGPFTFTGKVDDVTPYLAEMDVFGYPLRPDHYGTCELALGEAMAAGVVPVVMNNQVESHIIWNGENGLTAATEEEYINSMRILQDTELRERMAHHARESAKEIYSLDAMVRLWENVFRRIMLKPKKERTALCQTHGKG